MLELPLFELNGLHTHFILKRQKLNGFPTLAK